jgi:uncharacterized protein
LLVQLLWASPPARAQGLQPIPALTGHVIDQTGTLDTGAHQALESKLTALEAEKGSQVVLLLVDSTLPEDIASYANRVGNAWKIGRKGVGDGLLLIVAKQDRKVRIEVAKSLEGAVPDLAAKQVIDTAITPNFKLSNYGVGLQAAVDQIAARIRGEALPAPTVPQHGTGMFLGDFQWTDLAIFLFFAVPVAGGVARSIFGRKLGSAVVGSGVGALALFVTASALVAAVAGVAALILTLVAGANAASSARGRQGSWGGGGFSSGSSSWGSGGSSGGGFSSGGGGDFGGGGASGDW